MANVAGKNCLISVNMGDEQAPDWRKVGCSTTDGISRSTDTVDVATKCNGGFAAPQPGDKSWSFNNTSYVNKDHDGTSFILPSELHDMWANDEVKQWKFEAIDGTYNESYIGDGFITDYPATADKGDFLTFDLTITGTGALSNTPTT